MKANCGDYGGRILLGERAHLVTLDHVQCCAVAVRKRARVFFSCAVCYLSVILIHNIPIITISKRLDDKQRGGTILKRRKRYLKKL
jgi:hypothetical protein